MSLFSRATRNVLHPFGEEASPAELDREAEKWDRIARQEQADGNELSAQYARGARDAAKAEAEIKRA